MAETEKKEETKAEPNKILGYIDCGVCDNEVTLKEGKNGFCYYNHNGCCQVFSRSEKADAMLRCEAREKPETEESFLGRLLS